MRANLTISKTTPGPSKSPKMMAPDGQSAVLCRSYNYRPGHHVQPHAHEEGQLVYAVQGVMTVSSSDGRWIVPPTRGIWMPCGAVHEIRCIGEVHMRCVYIGANASFNLPLHPRAVAIYPLLRELIIAAGHITQPHKTDSRDSRLIRLLIDELQELPVLPLHLPQPNDPRLIRICEHICAAPEDCRTLEEWAQSLDLSSKTVQRLFTRQTGMTFAKWRQQARLLYGLERLAVGDKVSDVASALGYDSPSAFATMFKRQFSVPPREFFR
ncbi:AraC family transcriptional regulator [Comamonas testosteroni]|uniref:AraC family transcriptional regulator n=1 Tax=Comamonas testosteroni TaxID=285 RepID=UPI003899A8A4